MDSVFNMLYDINTSRFEKNVLLPILAECEEECEKGNRYDCYFINLFKNIIWAYRKDDNAIIYNCMGASINNNVYTFLDQFQHRYYKSPKPDKLLEEKLFNYLINDKYNRKKIASDSDRIIISSIELKEDAVAYEMFKKTWLGIHVENLSNFYEILLNKQQKEDTDFAQLLDL